MNKFIAICFVFWGVLSCNNPSQDKQVRNESSRPEPTTSVTVADSLFADTVPEGSKKQQLYPVLPDTTINKKLHLEDYTTAKRFYKDIEEVQFIERLRSSSVALFSNKNKKEYLMAYMYEGGTRYAFSCFEIGYRKDIPGVKANKTQEEHFETESGLKLGISLEKIELKKGKSYLKQTKGREVIITYRINDMESSSFLQWYAMPGYFIEITLTDNKATKIFFGFDYP